MEVVILSSSKEIGALAADSIDPLVRRKPEAVIGLATGSSPLAIYAELARLLERAGLSFNDVSGLRPGRVRWPPSPGTPSPTTRSSAGSSSTAWTSTPAKVRGPAARARDIAAACAAYEGAIRGAGGIDLQILGMGANGHIGFNEPGSSLASRTRIKTLAEQTRQDNARFFAPLAARCPPRADPGPGHHSRCPGCVAGPLVRGRQRRSATASKAPSRASARPRSSSSTRVPPSSSTRQRPPSWRRGNGYRHAYDNKPEWQGL